MDRDPTVDWPPGTSEMARRIRGHDWAATSLGQIAAWPAHLRTSVDIMLQSPWPVSILWGPDAVHLYNDAYIPIAGERHPAALGRSAAENWGAAYPSFLAPIVRRVFQGEAVTVSNQLIRLADAKAAGIAERSFTASFSAIHDESGAVAGVFHISIETTAAAGGEAERPNARDEARDSEPRQTYLLKLSDVLRPLSDAADIQGAAARVLGEYLQSGRAYYVEIDDEAGEFVVAHDWHEPAETSHAGRYPLETWPMPWLLNGQTWVVRDTVSDPAMPDDQRQAYLGNGIGALIVVPLVKEGRLLATFLTNQRAPRNWTAGEIRTVEETAERTWMAVERARAEAALRASEARLRKVLDIETVGVVYFDLVGGIQDANDAFLAMVGYTREELRKGLIRYATLTPADWRWRDEMSLAQLQAEGKVSQFEKEYTRKDGTRFWILCSAMMLDEHIGVEFIIDVTQRKLTETALRESEERLQLAVDTAKLATWDWNIARNEVTWSPEHFRMQGYAPGTVNPSYEAWLARVHPDDRKDAEAALVRARDSHTEYVHVFRSLHPDGTVVWISARAKFFYDEGGRATRVIGVMENITESYLAQEELRRSEERFRLMAENVRDYAIFMADPEDRITEWLPGAERVFGWAADEIKGKPASLIYTPEDREAGIPERELQKARESGAAPDVRWHLRKDGSRRFIEGEVTALFGACGEIKGFVKIGQDVTGRYLAEQALSESEERFQQFGEASPDVVWVRHARHLQMEYVSPAFARVYGINLGQLLEGDDMEGWKSLILPEDRDQALRELDRVRAGEKVSFEYRIRRPDGSVRWLRDSDFPLRDAQGRVIRIGGIAQDITEEKENIERMNVMVRELHHRTRNLLGIVQSIVHQTFRAAGTDPDECYALLSDRLQALSSVQDLLSRSEDNPITLEALLAIELEALAAEERTRRVDVAGPPVTLKNSALQVLALAIHELATNARKYGFIRHPEGRLRIRWAFEERPGEEPQLVFEWIEQGVARAAESTRGHGYGSQLIERALPYTLGAKVDYALTGEGARCVFRLPVSKVVLQHS